MNRLLIHGVFHLSTLHILKNMGVRDVSFDIRPQSLNFVPTKDLKLLIDNAFDRSFLTFADEKIETIKSYLNLLGDRPNLRLIIRDNVNYSFFRNLNEPFFWMFDPAGDWRAILSLDYAQGILLPLKFQNIYKNMADLWHLIEEKKLDVFIHTSSFEEARFINLNENVQISIDMTSEVESSYRQVDEGKLKSLMIWRKVNEDFTGQ